MADLIEVRPVWVPRSSSIVWAPAHFGAVTADPQEAGGGGSGTTKDKEKEKTDWGEILAAVASIFGSLGGGKPKEYKAIKAKAEEVVTQYGTNIAAGSAAMGVNANDVVKALSEYAAENKKLNLPISKITADQVAKYSAGGGAVVPGGSITGGLGDMTPLMIGAGVLALVFLVRR